MKENNELLDIIYRAKFGLIGKVYRCLDDNEKSLAEIARLCKGSENGFKIKKCINELIEKNLCLAIPNNKKRNNLKEMMNLKENLKNNKGNLKNLKKVYLWVHIRKLRGLNHEI